MASSGRFFLQIMLAIVLSSMTVACNSEVRKEDSSKPANVKKEDGAKREMDIKEINLNDGDRKNGLFDVSLEYDNSGVGWLAYSRVEIPKFIETQIAKSTDHGASWTHVTGIADSKEETKKIKGKSVKGVWRDETPALLFDPADKKNRRWKLFTNRYFTTAPYKPKTRMLGEGTINVKYATIPAGPWSKAECVVGNRADCKLSMKTAHHDVADVKMNTEPGAIMDKGVIYLSMDAGTVDHGLGEWENYRIVLLSSADHGASWRYAGILLNHKDAMKFGYRVFTGTSLVRSKGKLFVMATPSGALKGSSDHDGSMVFEITDIKRAKIKRDGSGKPIVTKRFELPKGVSSGGLADYDEQNTAGGVVFSTLKLFDFPKIFRIKQMGVGIDDDD